MGSIRLSMRVFIARAGAAALALPMLLGGAIPASATIVSHAMTPADSNVRYEYLGDSADLGQVLFGCQTRSRDPNFPRAFCYGPDQIRAAYDIQPLLNSGVDGTGRTIVIIDAFQSPTIQQDLTLFDHLWGYPDPTLNIFHPFGLTDYHVDDPNQRSWSGEISLDVEWAHVVAPGATIDLVLAPSNQDADILAVTKWAVDNNLGDVISQSFGEAEACMDPALVAQQHEVFTHATAKGITLFASSGDQGAAQPTCDGQPDSFVLSASTPASDPDVTAVGGTHLLADAHSGAYSSESVWNNGFGASGGGFSTIYRRPGYQAPFQPNNKQRGVPDVAYDGDVRGGVIAAWGSSQFGPGQFFIFGGTSAGSPQWAGIVALADQKGGHRLRAINTPLYHIGKSDAYGSAFHDITAGNNSFGGVSGFPAGPGWDAATGLGTPDVANLIPLLL